jgi:hypothetical protein
MSGVSNVDVAAAVAFVRGHSQCENNFTPATKHLKTAVLKNLVKSKGEMSRSIGSTQSGVDTSFLEGEAWWDKPESERKITLVAHKKER